MKKLISILASSVLIASTSIALVSCVKNEPPLNPLNIGKGIRKVSNAVNYDNGTNIKDSSKSKFTNYFIIGDSLSDVDGISSMLNKKKDIKLDEIKVDFKIKDFQIKKEISFNTNINLKLGEKGTPGYGFEEDGIWHSAFMNGKPAGYLLNEQLGFAPIKSSSKFSNKLSRETRNYSIGGATSFNIPDPITGIMLNDVTVDKQAKALISQHHVEKTNNDLVFFEIGGNDTMTLAGIDPNDTKLQNSLIKESMEKLKNALFTLLNNGIEKVIVGTPPDISVLPRYNKIEDESQKNYIKNMAADYNKKMLETINYVESYYPGQVQTYDIYSEFDHLKEEHAKYKSPKLNSKEGASKINQEDAFTNSIKLAGNVNLKVKIEYKGVTSLYNVARIDLDEPKKSEINIFTVGALIASGMKKWDFTLEANVKVIPTRNVPDGETLPDINSYFFTDVVHPTEAVHVIVANDLMKLAKKLGK